MSAIERVIQPIPPEVEKRGWKWTVVEKDGDISELDSPRQIVTQNPNLGVQIAYGHRGLEGRKYDGPAIEEANGGGAVVGIFHIDKKGEIYLGVLEQFRDAVGEGKYPILEFARGFSNVNESHERTAERELLEESGLPLGKRLTKLGGALMNWNTTYDITDPKAATPSGIAFFGLDLADKEVTFENGVGKIKPELLQPDASANSSNKKVLEKITGTKLLPLKTVINETPDMMTKALLAQWLFEMDAIVTPQKVAALVKQSDTKASEALTGELKKVKAQLAEAYAVVDDETKSLATAQRLLQATNYINSRTKRSWLGKRLGTKSIITDEGERTPLSIGFAPAKLKLPFGREVRRKGFGFYVQESGKTKKQRQITSVGELADQLQIHAISDKQTESMLRMMQERSGVKLPPQLTSLN